MIPVTRPFLPPKEEYEAYLHDIWESHWLTNMGKLAGNLETKLKEYLNVNQLLYVSSGTIALQMAIKALDLEGEIITTPFSFIATTSAIVWEGCQPVFVDIDPGTLNIDPEKIEAAISEKTTAILATHVYGNPCDVEAIEKIAQKHHLKVIYDAAHAFGVEIKGESVFKYGDISICSLHATKIYHSVEGGLLIAKDNNILKKLKSMRNFGFDGPENFAELGINAKNSEFHAAMGLANLKYIDTLCAKRKALTQRYDKKLQELQAYRPKWHENSKNNGAYYPLVLENETVLLQVQTELKKNEIQTRRYFYPSLATALPYLKPTSLPVTDEICKRVLCLPLYYDLTMDKVDTICAVIMNSK